MLWVVATSQVHLISRQARGHGLVRGTSANHQFPLVWPDNPLVWFGKTGIPAQARFGNVRVRLLGAKESLGGSDQPACKGVAMRTSSAAIGLAKMDTRERFQKLMNRDRKSVV